MAQPEDKRGEENRKEQAEYHNQDERHQVLERRRIWDLKDPAGRDQANPQYFPKGSLSDHGKESVSEGHREFDYLGWIAHLTSHIPERDAQLVHYYGAYSNAHRGIAARREVFEVEPTTAESPAG